MKEGDRIELVNMPGDPDAIPPGTRGTINWLGDERITPRQYGVEWDNGRMLMILEGVDQYRVITED